MEGGGWVSLTIFHIKLLICSQVILCN
jgi:hypothetical protein